MILREDPSVLEPHFFEGHSRRDERKKAEALVARDLMTAPPVTVGPQASVADAARLMHERRVKRLPVVDLEGRIVGIVSRMDLLAEFLRDDGDIKAEVCRVLADDLSVASDQVLVLVDDADFPGFTRVIWNDHVREMTELDADSRHCLMQAVFAVESAQRETLAPAKINLASLGNVTPHLHWHVIPRFADDSHFPQTVWSARQREAAARTLPADFERALGARLAGDLGMPG